MFIYENPGNGIKEINTKSWGINCGFVFNNFLKITTKGFMYFGLKYWFSIDYNEIGPVVFTLVLCPHINTR